MRGSNLAAVKLTIAQMYNLPIGYSYIRLTGFAVQSLDWRRVVYTSVYIFK
jgi:hypothetical protein